MKRCKDCIKHKKNQRFGEWCKSNTRDKGIWPNAEKCREYVRKWYKFWREK